MRYGLLLAVGVVLAGTAFGQEPEGEAPPAAAEQGGAIQEIPADERPRDAGLTEAPAPAAPASEELTTIAVPDAAPPAVPEGPQELDDVVVTAQKTKQPLRKVPVSVTALDGDFVADTGAADLADVSLYVPNVRVDADDLGSPQVFIRGFGTNAFNPSFESSVGFIQDEIFFGRPGYFTEAMFDVDRIEVLRGPQGTLFGKNTVAGLFNVISRGPENDLEGNVRYFHGENAEHRAEGGVGGLFTDWLGARLAALYRTQDGELYNQFLDRNEEELTQQAYRLKLRVYPFAGIDSELTVVTSETEAPFWPFQLMALDADTRDYLEGFDPAIEDDPYDFNTSFETPGFIEKGSDTAGLRNTWGIGEAGPLADLEAVLVIGTSTFYIDQLNELDVSPADIARLDNHEDHEQLSGELRLAGSADGLFGLGTGLEFVVGGFWFDSSYTLLARVLGGQDLGSYITTCDFFQLAEIPNPSCEDTAMLGPVFGPVTAPLADGDYYQFDYVQDISTLALFGQATWNITERWAITPGLRYNMEERRVDTRGQGHCQGKDSGFPQPCVMEQILMTQDYDYRDLRRDETDLSPKLALQYFSAHDVNYYASWARGYKGGGINAISFGQVCDDPDDQSSCRVVRPDELEYEPEEAQTLELGAKGKFFDSLGLNVTLYRTDFDNLQVLAFNGVFFDVSNAGQAQSQGLELDFQWVTPYEPLRVIGSAGLLDAKYKQYPGAPAPIRDSSGELQIGAQQDLAGQRIAFAPRQTATLTPMLTYLFGNFIGSLAMDVLYQGDQYTDTDLDPNTRVPAYTKYSARLTVGSAGGLWSVSLGGTNLTDERVLNQVTDAVFFPGTYYVQAAGGRQLFATVTLDL